jgi:ABC-type phosphate transport system substrate-binding protein
MYRTALAIFMACLFILASGPGEVRADDSPTFVVIVNRQQTFTQVSRKFLADAFLKKVTRWGDGTAIRPVDLTADAPARRAFSDSVLGRSVAAVKSYWQQVIFSGRNVPPPEFAHDEDIVSYVLKNPGAVGYVSPGTDVRTARVVIVK